MRPIRSSGDSRRQQVLELVLDAMQRDFDGCCQVIEATLGALTKGFYGTVEVHVKDGEPMRTTRIEVRQVKRNDG